VARNPAPKCLRAPRVRCADRTSLNPRPVTENAEIWEAQQSALTAPSIAALPNAMPRCDTGVRLISCGRPAAGGGQSGGVGQVGKHLCNAAQCILNLLSRHASSLRIARNRRFFPGVRGWIIYALFGVADMADTFLLRVHAKNCNLEALNTFRGSLVSFTHRQLRAPDALHITTCGLLTRVVECRYRLPAETSNVRTCDAVPPSAQWSGRAALLLKPTRRCITTL
jgi:hypothetical protein